MASVSFPEKICAAFYFLAKYGLAIGITLVMCVPAIYHFSYEQSHETVDHPLHQAFQGDSSLKEKLDSSRASYLYGKNPEEIEHFVDFYAHGRAQQGWKIVKWEFDADADLVDYVAIQDIKIGLEEYIDIEQERKTLWIIAMNNRREKLWQVRQLMTRYPNDNVIVIAEKKQKIPAEFKSFNIPEINPGDFESALVQHLSITKSQAKLLIRHYGSIHATIDSVPSECADLHCLLQENYREFPAKISSQEKSKLKQLCADGILSENKALNGLDRMGAFFYDENYYWRNTESSLNYELQVDGPIKGVGISGCRFVQADIMDWQIPSEVTQEVQLEEEDEEQQEEEELGEFWDDQHADQGEQENLNDGEDDTEKQEIQEQTLQEEELQEAVQDVQGKSEQPQELAEKQANPEPVETAESDQNLGQENEEKDKDPIESQNIPNDAQADQGDVDGKDNDNSGAGDQNYVGKKQQQADIQEKEIKGIENDL